MAVELPSFYRGDDHATQITVRVKDSQDPVDISGWLFTLSLKLSTELPDQPELDADGHRQVLQVRKLAPADEDSQAGRIVLVLPHSQTRQLIPTIYQQDIQISHQHTIRTLISGHTQVLPDVTHTIDTQP